MFKVGDRLVQIKYIDSNDVSPYCTITKIENGSIFHKHDGKMYKAEYPFGDHISIKTGEISFVSIEDYESGKYKIEPYVIRIQPEPIVIDEIKIAIEKAIKELGGGINV